MAPKIQSVPPTNDDWSIKTVDRLKYEELFESLHPVDGLLPGNKVRSVLMDSKLPLDALSKIWDLADQDRDGSLDKHEFVVVSLQFQTLKTKQIEIRKLETHDMNFINFLLGHAFSLPST